jgi:cytoskeletal protein CcmA (bactofilin family)
VFRRREHETRPERRPRPIEEHEVQTEPPRPQPSKDPTHTVLANGAKLTGTVVAGSSFQVDGEVEGTITAEGDVTLSAGSRVEADIEARNVTVGGHYKGNIVVKNRAELAEGARVVGNITCQGLVMAEGAWFEGQLSMGKPPEARAAGRS